MPKHKFKSENGSNKKNKSSPTCQLNGKLVSQADSYSGLFLKEEKVSDGLVFYKNKPFKNCQLNQVLDQTFLTALQEELQDIHLLEKNNDLYKFHQSKELNKSNQPAIREFRTMLMKEVKPLISQMTGAVLDDRLALFCARYEQSDYLLCHDDELEGRRIAFILYLVPDWGLEDGGALELFNTDETGNPSTVGDRLVPTNNSLVFFEVSPVSFHQVSEVLKDKTRLSLGGWFHGESLPRPVKPILPLELGQSCVDISEDLFYSLVNPVYLNPVTQAEIQEKFGESSEISLPDFLLQEKVGEVCEELSTLQAWVHEGTPNRRNLLSISNYSGGSSVGQIFDLMRSEPFFLLLSNLTGLKLHSLAPDDTDSEEVEEGVSNINGKRSIGSEEQGGSTSVEQEENNSVEKEKGKTKPQKEVNPTWKGRIRKWTQGNFTLVRDDDLGQAEFALDARICFNVNNWSSDMGGQTVYIARGEDEELVTVEPENNSLNLVYRDKESLRFVKYVNSSMKDRVFHDFDFTYYE